MSGPERVILGPRADETQDKWDHRRFGRVPRDPMPEPERPPPGAVYLERTIPPAYTWARFGAYELAQRVPEASTAVAEASSAEPRVCLMGVSRAGKTSLAVAMIREWVLRARRPAAFVHAHRLGVARIQHPAGHGEPEAVDVAMRMPLIVLDDLGSERDHALSAVPDVIFERDAQALPTWVTTGLTREQLVKRYGLGVVARVFERAKVIHVGGKTPRA